VMKGGQGAPVGPGVHIDVGRCHPRQVRDLRAKRRLAGLEHLHGLQQPPTHAHDGGIGGHQVFLRAVEDPRAVGQANRRIFLLELPWGRVWPVFIILAGLAMLLPNLMTRREKI